MRLNLCWSNSGNGHILLRGVRPNSGNRPAGGVLGTLQVIICLPIEPALHVGLEVPGKPQRRVRTDSAPLAYDLVDAGGSDIQRTEKRTF